MKNTSVSAAALLAVSVTLSALSFPILSGPALAAGTNMQHGAGHGVSQHGASQHGEPGKAEDVTKTIEVTMHDTYFEPEEIEVGMGETVRFVITNAGELVHEFNIGTAAMHKAHAPEMMMMVEHGVLEPDRINHQAAEHMKSAMGHGMHEEGNSILVEPGKTGEIIWKFPDHAELEFACNVPGHYDAGMMGPIHMGH